MGILIWIFVGLVAGFLAKSVMPESVDEPAGFIGTTILGVVGAVVGGWAWNLILNRPAGSGFDIGSIFVAFVGSCMVIGMARIFSRNTDSY